MRGETFRKILRLINYTGAWRLRFIAGVFGRSVNVFLGTYFTAELMGKTVAAIELKDPGALYSALTGMLPFLACIILIHAVSKYLTECGIAVATAKIRRLLLEKMIYSSLDRAGEEHSGKKLSYLQNDAPVSVDSLGWTLEIPLTAVIMGGGGLIYVIGVDWRLAALALAIGAFTLFYSIFFSRLLRLASDQAQAAMAVAGERLKNILDGAVTARIYDMRPLLERRYNEAAEDAMNAGIRFARNSAVLGGLNNANHFVGEKLLIFAAGLLLIGGSLDLPTLVKVSQMAGGVIGVFHISRVLPEIQKSLAGAQRIFDVLDKDETSIGGNDAVEPSETGNAISLSDVYFNYGERNPMIKGVSFTVEAGETVALVGDSGSGKSTLLRLMQGLLEPQGGEVRIFGTDTRRAEPASLRRLISFVPQDVVLFPGTISENIMAGCGGATQQQAVQAAMDANAHEFIMELDEGYSTYVTERGSSLSGGQRQRIAMARAFIRNTPIILLDEATASLDPHSEELIKQSLLRKKGKQTLVVVTHNLAVAEIADRIIYI